MFTLLVFLFGGILGAIVAGCYTTKPQDREVVEVGLKNNLPSDKFVSIEWIYFHLDLSPKDLPTLRHVLELYTKDAVIETLEWEGDLHYKLTINTLT